MSVRAGRLLLLVLPAILIGAVTWRAPENSRFVLGLGTTFLAIASGLALLNSQRLQEHVASPIIMLSVIALGWVLVAGMDLNDWFVYLVQGILLVIPLGVFAAQCLQDSGAPANRRALHLAQRLARRSRWPAELQGCRLLPEVKALRQALYVDASPALDLLQDRRPQVRMAALAALEFRPDWRPGQTAVVLNLAQRAEEPEVRAAAVNALGNVGERATIEFLAEFLHDPSLVVRQTACEALMWNAEEWWTWIRPSVRKAMADPICQNDGPLRVPGNILPREACDDLLAWASEKGILGMRAALTLGVHFGQVLASGVDANLIKELRARLADPHSSPMLRLELARLLREYNELTDDVLRELVAPSVPTPVRLIAVESLLTEGYSAEAVAALRDLARLPNREIALSAAEIVQRQLGVNLGLPVDQPLPPTYTRLAAEVARRVQQWAAQYDVYEDAPVSASSVGSGPRPVPQPTRSAQEQYLPERNSRPTEQRPTLTGG